MKENSKVDQVKELENKVLALENKLGNNQTDKNKQIEKLQLEHTVDIILFIIFN